MRRTAITGSYLQMLCLLMFSFFEELFQLLGYCFLQRVALHAGLSAFSFFEGLLYLWGCLACGVARLVERWYFVSCFLGFYK